MNKYKAVFSVPAEVLIELEVTAENQQEGLVAAHDAIQLAKPAQARVIGLSLSSAMSVSFDRVANTDAQEVVPPSPLSLGTEFTVRLFELGKCAGEPAVKTDVGTFEAARTLAESVLEADCHYGSASVHDQLGNKVLEVQAPRGGWEAEVVMTEAPDRPEKFSWLESFGAAKQTALQLLRRKGAELVRITDYTDRKKGPVLKKEIR